MNKKIDEEYKDIKDVYILQCICSELKDRIEKYRHLFKTTKTEELMQENERLHSTIKEVRDNLENSIKSINEKLKNNKEPFEIIDGRIQYINDYRVVRLKAFRTKCKELLEILDKENI